MTALLGGCGTDAEDQNIGRIESVDPVERRDIDLSLAAQGQTLLVVTVRMRWEDGLGKSLGCPAPVDSTSTSQSALFQAGAVPPPQLSTGGAASFSGITLLPPTGGVGCGGDSHSAVYRLRVTDAAALAAQPLGDFVLVMRPRFCVYYTYASRRPDAGLPDAAGTGCTTLEARVPIRITAVPSAATRVNLLANPGFENPTVVGGLPATSGVWQGDAHQSVAAEGGIRPRGGAQMLKFVATGAIGSTNTLASQVWQTVDLRSQAALIAAGGVRVEAGAWFNRVEGNATTDRRFDLRLTAFDGDPALVAGRFAAGAWLAQQMATLDSAALSWQQVMTGLLLPPGTTCLLVEIYAFEDQVNEAENAEFAGHYADDVSLVLIRP